MLRQSTIRALVGVLFVGSASCAAQPTEPGASITSRFDSFWSTFDRNYSYFSYKQINWDSLRGVYRSRAEVATSQAELVTILKEMVAPLRDVHVHFVPPAGTMEPTYQPAAIVNWNRDLWLATVHACGWVQVKPNLGYCTMGDVAYVSIGSWNNKQFTVLDLDSIVDRLRDARAMIVDVRANGGGDDGLAYAFAGRFTRQTVVSGYVRFRSGRKHDEFGSEITRRLSTRGPFQFTKPVVVLSGRGIFSSNESFIAAMREVAGVTIMGDTTGGATANPAEYPLGDGWRYSVSRWIEWTAQREYIEWRGIAPDVYVEWDPALVAAGRDPVLERALALLRQ